MLNFRIFIVKETRKEMAEQVQDDEPAKSH
jgi:hypothetical protein